MLKWHAAWEDTVQKMELLLANPRKFAWHYGDAYDVETEQQSQAREVQQMLCTFFVNVGLIIMIVLGLCALFDALTRSPKFLNWIFGIP